MRKHNSASQVYVEGIREDLFKKLDYFHASNVIAVTGGAGYGKTSFILSYVNQKKLNYFWYSFSEPVTSLESFFNDLLNTFSSNIENTNSPSLNDISKKLLPILGSVSDEFWIIMDRTEYIHLPHSSLTSLISFINELPHHIKFVLVGRKMPDKLPLSVWKMQGKLVSFSQQDLVLTYTDVHQLFQEIYQLPLSNSEVKQVYQKTEGWPAGVALFREAIKDLKFKEREWFLDKVNESNDLYPYLSLEVIEELSEELKSFLFYSSLCRTIEEEVLQEYLPHLSVKSLIKELHDHHLFISYDSEGNSRLHEMFRQYLYQQMSSQKSLEDMQSLHRQLASIYQKKYRYFEAFSHALASRNELMAVKITKCIVERYKPEHLLRLIDGWVENISPNLCPSKTSIFLYRCIPVSVTENFIEPLEELSSLYRSENQKVYLYLQHRLAAIYFYKGEFLKAITSCEESLLYSKKYKNDYMNSLNTSLLGQIYRFMHEHEKATSFIREALLLSDRYGYEQIQMQASWNLAELLLDQDELELGKNFALQSIELSKKCDDTVIVYPMCSMSKYYRKKGQINEAFKSANQALRHAKKYDISTDLAWVYSELGLCYKDNQELEEARENLLVSRNLFQAFKYQGCLIEIYLHHILTKEENRKEAAFYYKSIQERINHNQYHWLMNQLSETATPISGKSILSIQLLGSLQIKLNGETLKITRKTSVRLLLLLATYYDRRWSREEIIGMLFPDQIEELATNQFYVALSTLRKSLEPNLKDGRKSKFIIYDGSHYQFITDDVDLDLKQLEDLMKENIKNQSEMQSVIAAYKGDLLLEFPYEEFLVERRNELKETYTRFIEDYINRSQINESTNHFILTLWEHLLKLDPYEEKYYYQYLNALIQFGNKTKATKVAIAAVDFFNKELGISIQKQINQILRSSKRSGKLYIQSETV